MTSLAPERQELPRSDNALLSLRSVSKTVGTTRVLHALHLDLHGGEPGLLTIVAAGTIVGDKSE
jgi:hypothetical protein